MLVNPISLFLVVIAFILLLSGPLLAFLEIGLWGVPMLAGMILIIFAMVLQSDSEKRDAEKKK